MRGVCDPRRRAESASIERCIVVFRRFPNSHGDAALYLGPDALMPIASVFAAIAGFILMFWRRLVSLVKHLVQRISGRLPQP